MSQDEAIEEVIDFYKSQIKNISQYTRAKMMNGMGYIYWEETEEDFYSRMLEVKNGYLEYLKGQKDQLLSKVEEVEKEISKFKSKIKGEK